MTIPLRAFSPISPSAGVGSDSQSFRCDEATVAQVLDWHDNDPSRPIHSAIAEAERKRIWRLCREKLGDRRVLDCRAFDLLSFINSQPEVRSNWTRKRWNTTLQHPFNRAEKLGLILKNPFRGLSFPEGDEGRDWTDEEYAMVLRAASPAFRRLVVGLRLSGMRPHEGCDLTFPQIQLDKGAVRIDKHKTRFRTKRPRSIPLSIPLAKLFAFCKRFNAELLASLRRRDPASANRVFLTPKGRPWTRSHADSTFRRLREKLGLPADLKLHGCRHSFGTRAIMNDVNLAKVQQIMGHGSIRTTQRYVHLADKVDHLAEDMNRATAMRRKPAHGASPKPPSETTPLFDGLE